MDNNINAIIIVLIAIGVLALLAYLKFAPNYEGEGTMKKYISIYFILFAVTGCSDEKELRMLSNEHNNLLNEHKDTKAENENLKDANAKLEQQLVDSRAENKKLKADVIKFAIELKPRFTDVTTELEKLKKEIEQLKLDNNNLKEKRGKQEDK